MKTTLLLFLTAISFAINAQTISSVSPSDGEVGQTISITITGSGTNFDNASNYNFSQGANNLTFTATSNTATELVGTLDLTNAVVGYYNFSFFQDTSLVQDTQTFLVNAATVILPSITNISPSFGESGQTKTITITGANTNFDNASNYSFSQGSNNLTFTATSNTATELVGTLDLTNAVAGHYDFSFFQDTSSVQEIQAFFVNVDLGGTNTVSATITEGTGKTNGAGDPLVGVNVFLEDNATNNIVATAVTDANGFVEFTNIVDGDYNLHIENAENSEPLALVVNKDTDTENLNLQDNEDNLTLAINNTLFKDEYSFQVYPTIFENDLNISLNLNVKKDIKIEIFNVIGSKISEQNKPNAIGQTNININNIFKGKLSSIYFVKTTIDNQSEIIKVIKK